MTDPCIQIGKNIKANREKAQLSLKELARKAKMSEKRLLNIELGKTNLLLGTLIQIATALKISLSHLCEGI